MYLKKRLFAGLLALALLCTPFSGCAARKAERYDVLASTAPVRAMTAALLEWETIDADQIRDIMAGKPPRPPKQPAGAAPKQPDDDGAGESPAPSAPPEPVA